MSWMHCWLMVLSKVPSNNILGSLLVLRHTGGNCPPARAMRGDTLAPIPGALLTSDSGDELISLQGPSRRCHPPVRNPLAESPKFVIVMTGATTSTPTADFGRPDRTNPMSGCEGTPMGASTISDRYHIDRRSRLTETTDHSLPESVVTMGRNSPWRACSGGASTIGQVTPTIIAVGPISA